MQVEPVSLKVTRNILYNTPPRYQISSPRMYKETFSSGVGPNPKGLNPEIRSDHIGEELVVPEESRTDWKLDAVQLEGGHVRRW